jgi:6-phosphogluconolactonase
MKLIEYPDSELMMMRLADLLASQLDTHLQANQRATFAVPGGTTPGPVFDLICASRLDWARVDVVLTDERWVPEVSERSNTRLLRQRLLVDRAAAATLLPLYAEAPAPEDRLAELEAGLAPHLPVAVMLLGMGADMHTASIFPGADRLEQALTGTSLLEAMRAPGAPEPRVTLTHRVIAGAAHRHIVIIGNDKRHAIERAQFLPPLEAPVAAFLADTTIHWAEK